MKKSDEITEESKEKSNSPLLLSAFASVYSNQAAPKNATEPLKEVNASLVAYEVFQGVFKKFFKRPPPQELLPRISRYLPFQPNKYEKPILLANQALMMFAFDTKEARNIGYAEYLYAKFQYLIAKEGEDNQNQAEAILRRLQDTKNPALLQRLISEQGDISDAASRHFVKPMSTYEYAFWAGDTRMCRMLEKYMDEETKAKVLQQCKHIDEHGIDFTFKGELTQNSKHFDFCPLIAAYKAYIAAATLLVNASDWSDASWAPVDILWLNIGKELAKVPTHIAQEYCSNIPFDPLAAFRNQLNNPELKRTVKFYNYMSKKSDKYESWSSAGVVNSALGVLFAIYKGHVDARCAARGRARLNGGVLWVGRATRVDLAALTALCEMRTVNDRKQTLENLQPLAPDVATKTGLHSK